VIQREGQRIRTKIIGRKRDQNRELIGTYHSNPILNTRVYLAEYPDGHIQELSANNVIEDIYNQTDNDGNDYYLFQDFI
jgi:hypothetical protein